MASSSYDYPATGGGPSSGLNQTQVDDRISTLVAAQALAGNTQAWPGNKVTVTIPNTDGITEGSSNLFFTTERALAAAEVPLDLGAVTGGSQWLQLRTVSHEGGNAIDVPSGAEHGAADGGFLLELNGFYAQVPFNDLNELAVKASNDTTVDTSGNTQNAILFRSPDTDNGTDSIYVGLTSAGKLLMAGSHNDGTSTTDVTDDIKLYPTDHARHGTFNRDDAEETTLADDDFLVFFDTSGSFSPPKRISVANFKTVIGTQSGGGNTTVTAAQLAALVDNNQGNVDASVSSGKVVLTATAGGASFTLTKANLRPRLDEVLLVDSTLNKTVDTTGNTITIGVASSTTPTGTHTAYFGAQTGNSFASYDVNDATGTFDVSQSGASFWTQTDASPRGVLTNNGDYFYILVPADRSITSISRTEGGSNNLTSYPEVTGITINGTAYEARTLLNGSGVQGYNHVFVTVE